MNALAEKILKQIPRSDDDMKGRIVLPLTESEYLFISTHCKETKIFEGDPIEIKFVSGDKHYDIYEGYVHTIFSEFQFLLTKALNNELDLHKSIQEDIGFLWYEYLLDKRELPINIGPAHMEFWVGEDYNLWSSPVYKSTTWLYQKNGETFLEITPNYPWAFSISEPEEKYYSYEEFVKNYKPLVIRKIPLTVIKQWIKKTGELAEIVKQNPM